MEECDKKKTEYPSWIGRGHPPSPRAVAKVYPALAAPQATRAPPDESVDGMECLMLDPGYRILDSGQTGWECTGTSPDNPFCEQPRIACGASGLAYWNHRVQGYPDAAVCSIGNLELSGGIDEADITTVRYLRWQMGISEVLGDPRSQSYAGDKGATTDDSLVWEFHSSISGLFSPAFQSPRQRDRGAEDREID